MDPFGTIQDSPNPLDIGVQTFLGLTVVDFSCNSSWTSEGGQCTINLIQDDGQYLSESAVVGSPQYFEIVSKDNTPIFRFYGVLSKVSRSTDTASKTYQATIQSASLLLKASDLILDHYAGTGETLEAYGPNVPTCIPYGSKNSSISTSAIFNIQNLFGVYENDKYGATGAGFGRSVINKDGMRVDFFGYALDALVNGDPNLTPNFGSNIIYGSNSYDLISNKAYAYNFDILGFLSSIAQFIPNDYRVTTTNIMDFVSQICEEINHVFYVDLLKPPGAGNSAFGSSHESTVIPNLTHANTIYGGQIVIVVQNRNTSLGIKFPLSKDIIVKESSDKLGGSGQQENLPLDIGVSGVYHPDGLPISSSPYGGSFPYEQITVDNNERYSSTNLDITLTQEAVAAKYVVGGFQSRMNYISTFPGNNKLPEIYSTNCSNPGDLDLLPDVYCYWGEINIAGRLGLGQDNILRNVPVVTPFLFEDYEFHDFILVDVFDIVGNTTMGPVGASQGVVFNGIYPCSMREIRHAMSSYASWFYYMQINKPGKMYAITSYFQRSGLSPIEPLFNPDASLTYFGFSASSGAANSLSSKDTSSKKEKRNCSPLNITTEAFLKMLHEKVSKIGEEHYGQSFAVKMPAFSVKSDNDNEAPLNSFIKSWNISQDAYIDPPNYQYYEAPNGIFVNNNRVGAYANFECNFTSMKLPYGPFNQEYDVPLGFRSNYDFSKVQKDRMVTQVNQLRMLNSIPIEVSEDYLLLPPSYFTVYTLLSVPPLTEEIQRINILPQILTSIDFLLQLRINENGIGSVPFALVKMSQVLSPLELQYPSRPKDYISQLVSTCLRENMENSSSSDDLAPYPLFAVPRCFGIPQQSTRYVYGPWTTNIDVPYGARIEYVKEETLAPENYVIPGTITIDGIDYNILSGYEGMNQIGQLMADSVDDFDYLFTEEASVEIPGYPKITHIGQSLVDGGPLVSDVSVNIGASSVSTTYSMKTFAPKFGKANQFVIKSLTNLAKRIAALQKRV